VDPTKKATAFAVFFFPPTDFYAEIDQVLPTLAPDFHGPAEAFRRNLESVISTTALPFQMATSAVLQRRFQQLNIAERIRARAHIDESGEVPDSAQREAVEIARARFEEEKKAPDSANRVGDQVLADLVGLASHNAFGSAAFELLRQGTVLVWGALEVLAQDLFVVFVNQRPGAALDLMRDERTKRYFQLRDIPLDTLAEYDFDLSEKLGDVIVRDKAIDNLPTIRATFDVLAPGNEAMRTALAEDDLWNLNQRRHLIVHRRGIVDSAYLQKIGDVVAIGSDLRVSPKELERYLELVRTAGLSMLRALGSTPSSRRSG